MAPEKTATREPKERDSNEAHSGLGWNAVRLEPMAQAHSVAALPSPTAMARRMDPGCWAAETP